MRECFAGDFIYAKKDHYQMESGKLYPLYKYDFSTGQASLYPNHAGYKYNKEKFCIVNLWNSHVNRYQYHIDMLKLEEMLVYISELENNRDFYEGYSEILSICNKWNCYETYKLLGEILDKLKETICKIDTNRLISLQLLVDISKRQCNEDINWDKCYLLCDTKYIR